MSTPRTPPPKPADIHIPVPAWPNTRQIGASSLLDSPTDTPNGAANHLGTPASPPASAGITPPCESSSILASITSILSPPVPPPTPAPSPRPSMMSPTISIQSPSPRPPEAELAFTSNVRFAFEQMDSAARKRFLSELLSCCEVETLVHVSALIAPRLKRDFLKELPTEISLHVLSFIDDARALARASCVSKFWHTLLSDEFTWKRMCVRHNFKKPANDPYRAIRTSFCGEYSYATRRKDSGSVDWEDDGGDDGGTESRDQEDDCLLTDTSSSDCNSTVTPLYIYRALQSMTSRRSNFHRRQLSSDASSSSVSRRGKAPLNRRTQFPDPPMEPFSYKKHFKLSFLTEFNWRQGGRVVRSHTSADDGVVTSVAIDAEWIVVGLANHRIHVFSNKTGLLARTLIGHTLGVWCLNLVSKGGTPFRTRTSSESKASASTSNALPTSASTTSLPSRPSDVEEPTPTMNWGDYTNLRSSDACNSSLGWGQEGALVVSGACDRDVRVWDIKSGYCLHTLKGHASTIRCLKVLDGRPIAVTGSRDSTLRVWDIQRARCLHVLAGHTLSVRCLDVAGNLAVSGSYDCTAKLWNVDTGKCLHTFRGHHHQIYVVAFDGIRVATGSLDSTVRVWSAETGDCVAILQGHASLVGQLQLLDQVLVTGGSDGRVIIFSLASFETIHRLCAHDNSVTSLQFDDRFLITGGNDGHVKLFDLVTGHLIRELTEPCEAVWRINFKDDKCVILCKRAGKTVMEILSFKPSEEDL